MAYRSFEDLEVWKRSGNLAVRIYEELRGCKDFGLKDQMTRAAISIASNIAEGAERDTKPEYIRYLHIAKGSAAELRTQLYIAYRIGVIPQKAQADLVKELKEISSMLQGMIRTFKNKT
jgi:four helix bundle protein